MKSKLLFLGRDMLVYGLGGAFAKGIAFFLLPVYTAVFSPAEYGALEMVTVGASLLSSFMVMGTNAAQSFYFFKQKEDGPAVQAQVITATVQWRLAWGSVCVVVATLLSPLLNTFLFDGRLDPSVFAIAFASALFSQLTAQAAEVFRLLFKPIKYVSVTLIHALLTAGAALTLILVFKQGILGYFLGSLLAAACTTLLGWWLIRDQMDWSAWHWGWWPKLIRFGAPLVPSGFAMYVLNTSDRWFVATFQNAEELGVYAVGAKFAMMLGLAVQTFRLAWWPVGMEAMHQPDGPALFRTIARLYMGVAVAGVVLLTAVAPGLVRLLAAPEYAQAYSIVGVLAWYPVFYGFYMIVVSGLWKAERNIYVPVLMMAAAGLNIALNSWSVPRYGGVGAAAATSVCFFVWNVLALVVSERLWRVRYPYAILLGQVTVGLVAGAAISIMYRDEVNYAFGCAVAVPAAALLGWSAVSGSHRHRLWRKLVERRR